MLPSDPRAERLLKGTGKKDGGVALPASERHPALPTASSPPKRPALPRKSYFIEAAVASQSDGQAWFFPTRRRATALADDLDALLGLRFIERRDVKAWQFKDGHYEPERTKITRSNVRAHLACERTMGHYLVSPDNRCRLFAFDIDLRKDAIWDDGDVECDYDIVNRKKVCVLDGVEKHWHWNPRLAWIDGTQETQQLLTTDLIRTADLLARKTHELTDLPVAVAYSGRKGVHVYAFTGSIDASEAVGAAGAILEATGFTATRGQNFWQSSGKFSTLEIETFPKQDRIEGEGLGNLMRLPLGKHQATGERGYFLRIERGHVWSPMDAFDALNGVLPWAA